MNNTIDTIRHFKVFNPITFGNKRVDIIGAGAIGSKVILSLAKLGVENIHVWDMDMVKPHNLANQAFLKCHIGQLKTCAIANLCRESTGVSIIEHGELKPGERLGSIVFMCVDSMAVRKLIFDTVKLRLYCTLLIDTRMGVDLMKVYSFNPNDVLRINKFSETLCDDTVAEVSYCGSSTSIGATSGIVAELAVWEFLKYYNRENPLPEGETDQEAKERDNSQTFETIFCLRPYYFSKR